MRPRVGLYYGKNFDDEDAATALAAEVVQGAAVIAVAADIALKTNAGELKSVWDLGE